MLQNRSKSGIINTLVQVNMQVVLVTGGSRGIGAAIVRNFAEKKYTVILNYNKSAEQAKSLRNQLVSEGFDVHLYRADVADVKQVEDMFLWIRKYFKRLDVLVNNAGVACYSLCQDVTETDFDEVMNVNAKGTFFCCKHAIPLFLAGESGSIVNVSSIWGVEGASCESVYAMSKHAIVGLTKSLAKELAFSGINVNCICPSIVKTDMCKHLSQSEVDDFCRENDTSVLSVEQLAEDVFRLATGDSTGVILQER